jgi:glycosyltransferase involved in cell wall biosynthesis
MAEPLVSFVVPTKEKNYRVLPLLDSIRNQDYPADKTEIIIIDGGSAPKILEKCKKYNPKIYRNEKILAEGKGMGKDQGIEKSAGKYIVIAEADIRLIGRNWIKNMIAPLEKDGNLFASVPGLYVDKNDNSVNRYLSYVGVDPFAVFRSLEGQLALNRVPLEDAQSYFKARLDKKRPYCMGSNGFMFRRELVERVGGYAQDVEFIARLAKNNFLEFAIPKEAKIFHDNVRSFSAFMKKRVRWAQAYSNFYVDEKKDFVWVDNKPHFMVYVLKNLLFLPNIPVSVKKCAEYRDFCWLLHPALMFLTTFINLYYSLQSQKMLKHVFS